MQISLSDTGKRFNREWIFRNFSYQFTSGSSFAITGPNGSGKSTLLQVIAGSVAASEGSIEYTVEGKKMEPDTFYTQLSVSAPYQELIEEMTLNEFLHFHAKFKPFVKDLSFAQIAAAVDLNAAMHKQIRFYSSGMKQRVKLAQAIFSDTRVLLLDEPCTNLDKEGIAIYQDLISTYTAERIVVVSSNDINEYGFCKETINMSAIKLRHV
jgi:ABC-type multidrug transport system ATPase subunit